MGLKADLEKRVSGFLEGNYKTTQPRGVPEPKDIPLGNQAAKLEATALFIDMRQSSDITNAFRRQTAAKMVKGFFDGAVRIINNKGGKVRSFNGDGMLALFVDNTRSTNAVEAAMRVDWFVGNILQPKFKRYFQNNQSAAGQSLNFEVGCGLDDREIFAVKVGIQGTNDVAWVGKCTNTAAKLSSDLSSSRNIGITRAVYDRILDRAKYANGTHMWSDEYFKQYGGLNRAIRTSNYWESIS